MKVIYRRGRLEDLVGMLWGAWREGYYAVLSYDRDEGIQQRIDFPLKLYYKS